MADEVREVVWRVDLSQLHTEMAKAEAAERRLALVGSEAANTIDKSLKRIPADLADIEAAERRLMDIHRQKARQVALDLNDEEGWAKRRLYTEREKSNEIVKASSAERQAAKQAAEAERRLQAELERTAQAARKTAAAELDRQRQAGQQEMADAREAMAQPGAAPGWAQSISGLGARFAGPAILTAIGAAAVRGATQTITDELRLLERAAQLAWQWLNRVGQAAMSMAVLFTRAAVETALARDRMLRGLTAIMGGAEVARKELEDLKRIALMPGVDLQSALHMDVQLQAVGISARRSKALIQEFANANALIGGDPYMMQRAALQFSQMAGRGKVTGEEIRALAQDIPPMMAALRAAFGTTSAEQIEKLGLSFEEFTDRLLAQMQKLPRATGGMTNAAINLRMAWSNMLEAAGRPLIGAESIALLDQVAKLLNDVTPYLVRLGEAAAAYLPMLTNWLKDKATPEAVERLARRLAIFGVDGAFALRRVAAAVPPLIEAVANIAALFVQAIPSMQALWLETRKLSLEWRILWAVLTGQWSYAAYLEAQVEAIPALAKALAELNKAAGLKELPEKLRQGGKAVADYLRQHAGSTEEVEAAYTKARSAAESFVKSTADQAKAASAAACSFSAPVWALVAEAAALQRVTDLQNGATAAVLAARQQREADARQANADVAGLTGPMWAAARAGKLRGVNPADLVTVGDTAGGVRPAGAGLDLYAQARAVAAGLPAMLLGQLGGTGEVPALFGPQAAAPAGGSAPPTAGGMLFDRFQSQFGGALPPGLAGQAWGVGSSAFGATGAGGARISLAQALADAKVRAEYYDARAETDPQARKLADRAKAEVAALEARIKALNEAYKQQAEQIEATVTAEKRLHGQRKASVAATRPNERVYIDIEQSREARARVGLQEALTAQTIGNLGAGTSSIIAQGRMMSANDRIVSAVNGMARDTGQVVADAMRQVPHIVKSIVDRQLEVTSRQAAFA